MFLRFSLLLVFMLTGTHRLTGQSDFLDRLMRLETDDKMPDDFAEAYFGAKKNYYGAYDPVYLRYRGRPCGDYILLIYTRGHLVGSRGYLAKVKTDGSKKFKSWLLEDISDHDGSNPTSRSVSYKWLRDSIIQISHSTETVRDTSKIEPGKGWLKPGESFWDLETVTTNRYQYLTLGDCSISRLSIKSNALEERKYRMASVKLLNHEDIRGLSKAELRLMRNEIFAAYGYQFKSPALREYFSEMSWYSPLHDDVTDQLTDIERINAQWLLLREKEQ